MKVVAYIRVSTDQQAERGVSLDAQRAKVAAYATLYDLEVSEVVVDAGVSAKTLNRPGLQQALEMLDSGQVEGLLVVKLDRLTRSVKDLGTLLERYFAEGAGALFSVAEQVDTRSAAGRLVLNVLVSVAQWERETIGERTRDALGHLKNDGVRLGSAGMGWTHTNETDERGRRIIEAVEQEVQAVERILELKASGHSLRQIAAILTDEGFKTKRGGRWQANTVRLILRREAA